MIQIQDRPTRSLFESIIKRFTLTGQLNGPPQARFAIVELNGVFARVLLRGLRDLQPQLLSHHATLHPVRKGDGRIPETQEHEHDDGADGTTRTSLSGGAMNASAGVCVTDRFEQ